MGIWSKKRLSEEDNIRQLWESFGSLSHYYGSLKEKTENRFPELVCFGENILAESTFDAVVSGHDIFCLPTIKIYRTERQLSFHRYQFYGSAIHIKNVQISRQIYAYTGKPFGPPENGIWEKEPGKRPLHVYTAAGNLSPSEAGFLSLCCRWLEDTLCSCQSYRYALCFSNSSVKIIFGEPEIYPFSDFLRIVEDAMEHFPKPLP